MFSKPTFFWLLTLGLSSVSPAYGNLSLEHNPAEQDDATQMEMPIKSVGTAQSASKSQGTAWARHQLPKVLQNILVPGMSVSQQFSAQSGLTGWVLSADDNHTLVYTTADEQTLITGTLLDNQGNNLSEYYTKRYLPEADFTLLTQAHSIAHSNRASKDTSEEPDVTDKTVDSGATDSTNTTPSVLYVFFDPNCPFCHFAWQALDVYQQQGAEIRWIPVAYLQPDSRVKAAALLQAAQPEQALNASMTQQAVPLPETGISEASDQALSFNMQLMKRFALQGTPAFVWQDSEQQLQSYSGMPKLATFAEMTGLEEQPQSAPELARFR